MSEDPQTIAPVQLKVSGKTLALITGGGLVAGALIVLGAIMPAEFNTDPLGIGKLSGIARLWAPDEKKVDTNTAGPARSRIRHALAHGRHRNPAYRLPRRCKRLRA